MTRTLEESRAAQLGFMARPSVWLSGPIIPACQQIEAIEKELLELPQVECPVTHHFQPGCYCREIFMPAGTFVLGHEHKTEHQNIILSGCARVWIAGGMEILSAPMVFSSKPGVRKLLHILEDMRWLTVHPTTETDEGKLRELLIVQSPAFVAHQMRELEHFKRAILAEGGTL